MISISNSINKMKEYKSEFERYIEGEGKDGGHKFDIYGVCQCGKHSSDFKHDESRARGGYLGRLMFCPIYIKGIFAKHGMTTFFELNEATMQPVEYIMISGKKIPFIEYCTLIVSHCMFEDVYYHRLLNNY